MIRLAILIFLAWVVYKVISDAVSGKDEKKEPLKPPAGPVRDELVQDPNCLVYFPKSTAFVGEGGRHFCSAECREAWEKKRKEAS